MIISIISLFLPLRSHSPLSFSIRETGIPALPCGESQEEEEEEEEERKREREKEKEKERDGKRKKALCLLMSRSESIAPSREI